MDDLDRELLNILQADFPLVTRPYRKLAEQLGTSEDDVLSRVRRLAVSGVVRRIGPVFDSRKLGHASTLVAMRVPPDRLDDVAAIVGSHPQVTHNYGREHEYNLWFTLICPSLEEIDRILEDIRAGTGIEDIIILPAEKVFKIGVRFELR